MRLENDLQHMFIERLDFNILMIETDRLRIEGINMEDIYSD